MAFSLLRNRCEAASMPKSREMRLNSTPGMVRNVVTGMPFILTNVKWAKKSPLARPNTIGSDRLIP